MRLLASILTLSVLSVCAVQASAQTGGTNFLLKQCEEYALVLQVDPGAFQETVGTDFSLVLQEGKAISLIIVQDCSQYWLDGVDLGPTQHTHLWLLVEGPRDVRSVVGAELTQPTRTWFSLFAGSSNPRGREARKVSGTSPEPIEGARLDASGAHRGGQVNIRPGLRFSWSLSPSPPHPPIPTGVNHDVYVRDSADNIILKRIQVIAMHATEPRPGTLEVVGSVEAGKFLSAGTYPVQGRFFPVWARVTLGDTTTGSR